MKIPSHKPQTPTPTPRRKKRWLSDHDSGPKTPPPKKKKKITYSRFKACEPDHQTCCRSFSVDQPPKKETRRHLHPPTHPPAPTRTEAKGLQLLEVVGVGGWHRPPDDRVGMEPARHVYTQLRRVKTWDKPKLQKRLQERTAKKASEVLVC